MQTLYRRRSTLPGRTLPSEHWSSLSADDDDRNDDQCPEPGFASFCHRITHNPEAECLIRSLVLRDPKARPTASQALHHPYFWDPDKCLRFLLDVSDRVESDDAKSEVRSLLFACCRGWLPAAQSIAAIRKHFDRLGCFLLWNNSARLITIRGQFGVLLALGLESHDC